MSGSYNASCDLPPCLELAPRSEVADFPTEKMPLFHTITLQTNDARFSSDSFCDKVEFCISCHQSKSSSNSVDTTDIDVLLSSVSGGTVNYYDPEYLSIARLITNSPNDTNSLSLEFSKSQHHGRDNEVAGESEPYRFTGKPYSSATGLYYSFQRWYDPEIGRFISEDLVMGDIGQPQTLNRYAYVGNSPTNYVDPTGLAVETPFDIASAVYDVSECARDPNLVNCGIAAIDVALIFVPGIPAVAGPIYRGGSFLARHGDDAVDVARTISRLDGAVVHLDDLTDLTVVNRLGDFSQRITPVPVPEDVYLAARRLGVYGNMPDNLARGQFAHDWVKWFLQDSFETSRGILGRNFPDAFRSGGIIEVKPFHQGVDPFTNSGYLRQLDRYIGLHGFRFPGVLPPHVKFILHRFI